jgi:hypothetical protein
MALAGLALLVACNGTASDADNTTSTVTTTVAPPTSSETPASTAPPVSAVSTSSTDTSSTDVVGVATTPVASALPAPSAFTVQEAIGEVPAGEERAFQLVAADVATATLVAGLQRPTDPAAVQAWADRLTGEADASGSVAPVFVPVPESLGRSAIDQLDVFEQVLGWSLLDVDTFVDWSNPRLGSFTVVTGPFNDQTLSASLAPVDDRIVTHFEGEDGDQHILDGDAVSPIGNPIRFAYSDGRIGFGTSTPTVRAWLDDTGPTIGDDPDARSIAQSLDDADAISAVIIAGGFEAVLAPATIDTAFSTAAVGWSLHDGGPVITMVWATDDAPDAEALGVEVNAILANGVSRFGGLPISDSVQADSVDIQGNLVIATVHPTAPDLIDTPYTMLALNDTLFQHN